MDPDKRLETSPLPNYRPCVAMVVANDSGETLLARRRDLPDAWQYPQGGVEFGETPAAGCLRELREETGLTARMVRIITGHPRWLPYEFPQHLSAPGRLGQVQAWFLLQLRSDSVPDLQALLDGAEDDELLELRWATPQESLDGIVPFKRGVYGAALGHFAGLMSHLPCWTQIGA